MPQIPTWEWIERTVIAKENREQSSVASTINTWNLLVREVKSIANVQKIILKRLSAYGEKLCDLEQEVCITSNAANNGVEEVDGVKKARRIMEVKMLKTFDFMDGKLDYVHERINKLEENNSKV